MKNIAATAGDYLLMARPYSLVDAPLMVIAAKALAEGAAFSFDLPSDGLKILVLELLWLGLNWYLESTHKHENRPAISRKAAYAAFAVAGLISASLNPLTILPVLAYACFTWLYSQKEGKHKMLGAASFLSRGLTQAFAFATACLLYGNLGTVQLLAAIAVFLMTCARSLVGDLRDVKFDRTTLPVRIGERAARKVAVALKVAAAVAVSAITSPLCAFPLFAKAALHGVHKNDYDHHRASVVVSSAVLANLAFAGMGSLQSTVIVNLVFLTVILGMFYYEKVPRPSNPLANPIA
jgi:hypothetical protein